jgi:hypothetical protein
MLTPTSRSTAHAEPDGQALKTMTPRLMVTIPSMSNQPEAGKGRNNQLFTFAWRGVSSMAFWGPTKSVAARPHAAAKDNHNPGIARFPVT